MTAQMRAMLDELMGTARNGKDFHLFTNATQFDIRFGGEMDEKY